MFYVAKCESIKGLDMELHTKKGIGGRQVFEHCYRAALPQGEVPGREEKRLLELSKFSTTLFCSAVFYCFVFVKYFAKFNFWLSFPVVDI